VGVKKKELEKIVGSIPDFSNPRVELEQYASPPHLVSRLIWVAAFTFNDIIEKNIIDLGSGTGRIGLAAAFLGASQVTMVEIDKRAARTSWEEAKRLSLDTAVDVVCSDIKTFNVSRKFATAIQNPPFGVHRKGADIEFLKASMKLALVVYSVHKHEALDYLIKWTASKGVRANVIFEETILLPRIYKFHYKQRHEVKVVVVRLESEGLGFEEGKERE